MRLNKRQHGLEKTQIRTEANENNKLGDQERPCHYVCNVNDDNGRSHGVFEQSMQ